MDQEPLTSESMLLGCLSSPHQKTQKKPSNLHSRYFVNEEPKSSLTIKHNVWDRDNNNYVNLKTQFSKVDVNANLTL